MAFPSSSSFDSSNEPMPQSETDDNFLTETAISKEVNISNEGVIEEDLVCMHCHTLEKENRRLRNRIVTLEEQVSRRKRESRRYRRRSKKPCKKVIVSSSNTLSSDELSEEFSLSSILSPFCDIVFFHSPLLRD